MDDIASSVAMCDGEIQRLELIRTIPLTIPRGRYDRIRKEMQHFIAAPVSQADWKELGRRRFELLCAGCDQMEGAGTGEPRPRDGNSIPCAGEPAPCKVAGGVPARNTVPLKHAKLFRGQFSLLFQVTTKHHVI
ncbi:unnamed protein product [Parnassius mnemosyne]|uniref:Uncharacterized protein n=1 Tax=Parnassius mnemosyne TaxID=213953 RepID=A0AAV1M7M0_9NEOP